MRIFLSEKKTALLLLSALAVFFAILTAYSEVTYDVGDGIRHFMVSKYSWQHSNLFMYSWGKPFFTLISSPFSQFGINGIYFFNILCGVLSG
jgi:hypothetical protein